MLPFAALVVANVVLAFGPWFVRHADTGPVAAGLWRIAVAAPVLAALAVGSGARPIRRGATRWWTPALSGVAFAADLASWHLGIHQHDAVRQFGNADLLDIRLRRRARLADAMARARDVLAPLVVGIALLSSRWSPS